MTQREALMIVQKLMEAYPRMELSKPQIAFFAEQLLDIPLGLGSATVVTLARTSTFPPSIAEFRRRALEVQLGETADVALVGLLRACMNAGSGPVDLPEGMSPLARRVLQEVGGITRLRMSSSPEYFEKDFRAAYERELLQRQAQNGMVDADSDLELGSGNSEQWKRLQGLAEGNEGDSGRSDEPQ